MISHLQGTIIDSGLNYVVLDVNGVGYKVFTHNIFLEALSGTPEVALWTFLAVRENALDLYGFETKEELDFFKLLTTVSGIGPKSALGILNVASIDTLTSAIASGDSAPLTKVSGIGKKSAEKIVLELKDKFKDAPISQGSLGIIEATEALRSLGYSHQQVRDVLQKVKRDGATTGDIVREALKILGQ